MKASDIIWVKNEDGSYTFTNSGGTESSIYAWYVLNEDGQIIYRTRYSESPHFIFDLKENRKLVIKGFIRTKTGEAYHQVSAKVDADRILGRMEYAVASMDLTEKVISIIKMWYLNNDYLTLPEKSVLTGDGSAWNVELALPVDWNCPEVTNRQLVFYINGFTFLDAAYAAYYDTRNEKYAYAIMGYVLDWVRQNKEYIREDKRIWHDDTTAVRLMRMSLFYCEFRKICLRNEQELIMESLKYQAELLTTDEFYKEKHNHGMHQDIALLLYALLLADNSIKEKYISLALSRIGEYIEYVYTKDGIHKEHSPGYAGGVLKDMIFLQKIAAEISPEFAAYIGSYVRGAQEYLIQILKPDGTWPSLGDSGKIEGVKMMSSILDANEEYRWIVSNGLEGVMPKSAYIAIGGGYSVFRSSWKDRADEATWIMFVASTFSSTHKHGDDLEVLLYHKGDLFVEGGNRNYNYSDKMTAWVYSGYAHNVLLINGEAYPVKIGANGFQSIYPEALETGIIEYTLEGNDWSVKGRERRFPNVEQTRTLTYDRSTAEVVILDHLEALKEFEGILLYHIAEDVVVEERSEGWNLYRNSNLVAEVSVACDVGMEICTIKGKDAKYPYSPWIFEGQENPVYGSLLMVRIMGKPGKNRVWTRIYLK